MQNLSQLQIAVPALNPLTPNGVFVASLRGVGTAEFGLGQEIPVPIYIDGVYYATPAAAVLLLNNIASIDVLKGPQGTLFGRNATGGAIQITTSTPTQTPHGNFSLSYGNYGILDGTAYISGGIANNLAADLSFTGITQSQGFGKNLTTGAPNYRTDHDIDFRSKWVWTPTKDTMVTFIADYNNFRDNDNALSPYPGRISGFTGLPDPNLGYNSVDNVAYGQHGWDGGLSLRLQQDVGAVRLSSLTAVRQSDFRFPLDISATAQNIEWFENNAPESELTQEFQAASTGNGRLQWTVGVYYFQGFFSYDPFHLFAYANTPPGGPFIFELNLLDKEKDYSWAGYGQITYELFDRTRLTLGVRYTTEERQEDNSSENVNVVAICPGPFCPGLVRFPNRHLDFSTPTYRINLDHRFSDDVMAYISYNTGFDSGGFNADSLGADPYKPEYLDAYEAGVKSELLDRRIRLNVEGFYYNFKNIQIQKVEAASIDTINGAGARIYGLDADATVVISPNLDMTFGLVLLSPKFTSFQGCPTSYPVGDAYGVGNCTGKQIPFTQKATFNVGVNYTRPLAGGMFVGAADLEYNSGEYFEPDNILHQGEVTMLNGSLMWKAPGGYSIGVFGKNLTNQRVIGYALTFQTFTNANLGAAENFYLPPLTYGVKVAYEF